MNQGDILKQYGIEQVERHNTDFVAIMRGVAVDFATIHGRVTSDDVRLYANLHDIYPAHPNAWGAVFKDGFRRVGFVKSQIPSNHSRMISVWELK